jgi:hypothetical protein
MISKKNKIKNRIKDFFPKIPRILVEHFFTTLFFLLILDLALTGVLLYKYYLQKKDLEFQVQILGLNEKLLNDVLEEWQKREEIFKAVDSKQYLDLFRF